MPSPRTTIYLDSNGNLVAQNPETVQFDTSFTLTLNSNGRLKITGGGASSSSTAADEHLTDSGDHTFFTLSYTPLANTLMVINENTGQIVPASAYTNIGTSVIFLSSQSVDDGSGNFVTPTFRARYSH
jgi:hypothetical protein